jgi:hypothetical protein
VEHCCKKSGVVPPRRGAVIQDLTNLSAVSVGTLLLDEIRCTCFGPQEVSYSLANVDVLPDPALLGLRPQHVIEQLMVAGLNLDNTCCTHPSGACL